MEDQVRASFDRCEASGDFAEEFYQVFLNSSPEIGPLFAKTDFVKQRKLIRASVYIMVTRSPAEPTAREALDKIGHSHGRTELDIRPELYELWLDSLCETIKRMDPEWTPELQQEWRDRLRPAIEAITALY